jgi:HAMP domain
VLAAAALRPVERMRRQVAEISDQDRGRRLPVPATWNEIAALGVAMNGLLARLQQALEGEREFVADAGQRAWSWPRPTTSGRPPTIATSPKPPCPADRTGTAARSGTGTGEGMM